MSIFLQQRVYIYPYRVRVTYHLFIFSFKHGKIKTSEIKHNCFQLFFFTSFDTFCSCVYSHNWETKAYKLDWFLGKSSGSSKTSVINLIQVDIFFLNQIYSIFVGISIFCTPVLCCI